MRLFDLLFIKIRNIRNLYFLIFLFSLNLVIIFLLRFQEYTGDLSTIYGAFLQFFTLWLIISIVSERSSGLTAKLISNGRSRRQIYLDHVTKLVIYSVIAYLVMVFTTYELNLLYERIRINNLLLLALATFGVMIVAFFIAIFIKKPITALLVGYFAPQMEKLIYQLVVNHGNPIYSISLPYHNAQSLMQSEFPVEYGLRLLATIVFSFMILRITFKKVLDEDYTN